MSGFDREHTDRELTAGGNILLQKRFSAIASPGPGITKPERGQDMQGSGLRPAIDNVEANQDIGGGSFGILHKDIEVAIVGKDAGIEQLKLRGLPAAPGVLLHE